MSALLIQYWPHILAGAAALFGAWKIRQSGVNSERNKQRAKEADARDIADQVDNDVGAFPGAKARKELGKWGR